MKSQRTIMAGLHLRTLGGFEARLGRRVVRLPRKALLAYLALAPGATASRASLATLLWGDGTEDEARNNLRQVLFRIRRSLGSASPALILDGDAVSLRPELVDADVLRFQRLAAAGGAAALEEAAALYRGDLLSGLAVDEVSFEDWLRGERARLRELGIDVLSRLLAHRLEAKSFERAIQTALQLLALDPLQEHVHRALMRAYASDGRRPAALRQYQLCVDVLQRELQAEPEPETRSLYLEVLRQPRSACALAALSVPVPASPAPRPRPLSMATPLVGRDAERKRLVQELAAAREGRGRVVAILGEAGVGKTRMSQELVAEAAAGGCLVLEGCAHETERELPFGLWVGVLRSAGVANEGVIADLAPAWRHALAPLFPEVIRDRARRAPTEDQLRLFEALTHLMRTLAVRQPLLVLVEDLHWADATSVRFLAFLGRRLGEAPICVVATARAEDAGSSGAGVLGSALAELETGGQLTEIALAPLWRSAAEQLVAALTPRGRPRPSPELLERIWRMSEGNAFVERGACRG